MKKIERKNKGQIKWLIGVDEVGRGPLAGPVAVCACAIPYYKSPEESYKKFLRKYEKEIKARNLPSLAGRDSKKLSESQREAWKSFLIKKDAIFMYSTASANNIDNKGIAKCIRSLIDKNLEGILSAGKARAANALVLLDGGLKAHSSFEFQKTIIKGDEKEMVISFASIFAKVTRDGHMKRLSKKNAFLPYAFNLHKGYGTLAHRKAIEKMGLSTEHRTSFCKNIILTKPLRRVSL